MMKTQRGSPPAFAFGKSRWRAGCRSRHPLANLTYVVIVFFFLLFIQPVSAAEVSLNFIPDKVTVQKGEMAILRLNLKPDGQSVIGVDVKLSYDPFYLELVEVRNSGVFSSLLGTQIDNTAGNAKFALVNEFDKFQSDDADIVELVVKGKNPASSTRLTFDFTRGRTQDTNVAISGGQDVLTTVNGVIVTITDAKTSASTTSPGPSPAPSLPTVSPQVSPTSILAKTTTKFPGVISPLSDPEDSAPSPKPEVLGATQETGVPFDFVPERGDFAWEWMLLLALLGVFVILQFLRKLLLHPEEKSVYSS